MILRSRWETVYFDHYEYCYILLNKFILSSVVEEIVVETICFSDLRFYGMVSVIKSRLVCLKLADQELILKIWLFDKTWLCCEFCQCFHWVGILFMWYSKGPHPLLFWQIGFDSTNLPIIGTGISNECRYK